MLLVTLLVFPCEMRTIILLPSGCLSFLALDAHLCADTHTHNDVHTGIAQTRAHNGTYVYTHTRAHSNWHMRLHTHLNTQTRGVTPNGYDCMDVPERAGSNGVQSIQLTQSSNISYYS